MIFINKTSAIPPILLESQRKLKDSIKKYGSFNIIPEVERDKIVRNYNHRDIKEVLFNCSYEKCSYCEIIPSSSYMEVDHFEPKSRYPELVLDWENLLPACRKCNSHKSSHDTRAFPIINPTKINPEPYFDYDFFSIKPSNASPNWDLSERTIIVCNLNRYGLSKERGDLLNHLDNYQRNLESALRNYINSDTELKKRRRIEKIRESIEVIDDLAKSNKKLSGLCRNFLNKSLQYKEAKQKIDEFQGAHPDFEF